MTTNAFVLIETAVGKNKEAVNELRQLGYKGVLGLADIQLGVG